MKTLTQTPLGEIIATRAGTVDPALYPNETFDLYSIPAFDKGEPDVLLGQEIGSTKQVVQPGDLLLSKIVPHIRRSWVVGKARGRRLIASSEWIVFRSDRFHSPYLRHVLTSDPFHVQFMGTVAGVGGSLLRARPAQVASLAIPLPLVPEQRRIANILDKADAVRRKRQDALNCFEDLSDSSFRQLSFDSRTQPRTIEELIDSKILLVHKDGNFGGSYPRKEEFGSEGIPFLSAKHVAKNGTLIKDDVPRLNEGKARTLPFGWIEQGDVLLAHNATVGPVALYLGDYPEALIGTSLTCYRPNPKFLKSEFLFAALRGSHFQRQLEKEMSQTTRNQVPITAQRKLTLHIPKLEVQTEFAKQLAAIHLLRDKSENAATETDLLFNSLVQKAFHGEL